MTACLAILAVSGVLGCADTPVQVPTDTVSANVAGTDSVALTYICGNMFRVRNSAFDPRSVRWDIYNAAPADTGSLRARGRDVGSAYVDYFVTARTNGTMRLFVGTTLIATKANGNKAACAAPADSTPLPSTPNAGSLSAKITVESPSTVAPDNVEYRRRVVNVRFRPTATATERRAFQSQFAAQLIAVFPSFHRFRVPDPGSSYSSFSALLAAMSSHPAVLLVRPIRSFDRVVNFGSRYPDDGVGARRADYLTRGSSVWPAAAMRLPQAWWCETGRYGSTLPRIAVYEQNFPLVAAPDVAKSLLHPVVRLTAWRDTMTSPPSDSNKVELQNHGHAVAALITASGDDSVGVAGAIWRSDLRVFTFGNTEPTKGAGAQFFVAYMLDSLLRSAPQVLSLSSDVRFSSDTVQREADLFYSKGAFQRLLDSLPRLVIVQAIGNDSYQGLYSARDSSSRYVFQEALVSLRALSPQYESRIIFVGETNVNGSRPSESNAFTGLVDLYAPGFDVPILLPNGTVSIGSGTSFAAPTVAGIAGQLLAMDSTLSAADVKALLLAGARDSVENSNGDNVAPNRVGNTTDVVYEADAYGSLRRLSALGGGRPLCGANVTINRDPTLAPGAPATPLSVVIRRYLATTDETLTADASNSPLLHPLIPGGVAVSIAPGGRTIALSAALPARGVSFSLLNNAWAASGSFATTSSQTRGMQFGERDTLLLTSSGFSIAGTAGTTTPVDIAQLVAPLAVTAGSVSLAPDGSRFAFIARDTNSAGTRDQQLWVINRVGAPVHATLTSGADWMSQGRIGWTVDSRNLIAAVARPAGSLMESQLIRGTVANTITLGSGQLVAGLTRPLIESISPSDEGNRLWLRVSGAVPNQPVSPLDCALYSVRTSTLADPRFERQLFRESCDTSTPPPDDGGGYCWYREALPRSPSGLRAGSAIVPPGDARPTCVNGAIP